MGFRGAGCSFRHRIDCAHKWTRLQDHARTAPERRRVDRAPVVRREITYLDEMDLDLAGLHGTPNDAGAQRTTEHFREQGDYRYFHLAFRPTIMRGNTTLCGEKESQQVVS